MASDGASFQIDLGVGGAGAVDSAATSLAALADKLTAAGAASTLASDAVRASEGSFRAAEASADKAAKAVEKIGLAADAQRGKLDAALKIGDMGGAERAAAALNQLVMRQTEAAAKSSAAAAAIKTEAAALDKLKSSASSAAEAEAKLSKSHDHAKTAAAATSKASAQASASFGKTSELAAGFGALGGPLGALGQKAFSAAEGFKKLGTSLGAAGPYVAIAVAAIAVATAFVLATAAVLAYGIANADAARTSALLSDGVAGSVAGGRELDKTIGKIQQTVAMSKEELRGMASTLAKTGLSGDALTKALEEAATKAAKLKWGPDFAKETLSLTFQAGRLKDALSNTFGGLKIEGLLKALSKLIALFDSTEETGTSSGKAIKTVFESLFQPLVNGIEKFIPMVVSAFIQFEILVLKALIAIYPFESKIFFVAKVLGILAAVIIGIVLVAVTMLVVASLAFAAVLGTLIYVGYQVATFFISLATGAYDLGASIIGGAGAALSWLYTKFAELVQFLTGISLGDIGKAMIDGLVLAITGGATLVINAIKGAVGGALDAAKKLIGFGSPAQAFIEVGASMGEGVGVGVQATAGGVQSALETMVSPPEASSSPAKPAASSSEGGGGSYAGAIFNFYGVEGAEDAVDRFLKVIEGDAAQMGTMVPA